MAKTYERVTFRLIWTPCCHTLLCYVNPRLPNFCSECGESIYLKIKNSEFILLTDEEAGLRYRDLEESARVIAIEKAYAAIHG